MDDDDDTAERADAAREDWAREQEERTVFVLMQAVKYEGSTLLGVYSSQAAADRAMKIAENRPGQPGDVHHFVEEQPVDPPSPEE